MDNINSVVNNTFKVLDSDVASSVIGLFLILYAGLAAPKLPKKIASVFDNTVFKIIFMFLIAYMASKNKSIALIASIGLILSFQTLNRHKINDKIISSMEEEINNMNHDESLNESHNDKENYGYSDDDHNISEILNDHHGINSELDYIGNEENSAWGLEESSNNLFSLNTKTGFGLGSNDDSQETHHNNNNHDNNNNNNNHHDNNNHSDHEPKGVSNYGYDGNANISNWSNVECLGGGDDYATI